MDDLISRQDAIEDAHRQIWYRMNQQGMKDRIDEWLKNLPSDQSNWKTDHGYMWLCPSCGLIVHSDFDECVRCGNKRPSAETHEKRTKTRACDLISRQAAIEAIRDHLKAVGGGNEVYTMAYRHIAELLAVLPSAEPEHKCNSCRYRNLEWNEEPCDSCTMGGESNHWKPSAEPMRKKGEWMPQNLNKSNGLTSTAVYYYPKCSVCGSNANYTNFCPNCGADMRGEVEIPEYEEK